ncbi:MAG TPA: hypothetical protein VGD84_00130, partial [Pseudonocardiaceae bacterium]
MTDCAGTTAGPTGSSSVGHTCVDGVSTRAAGTAGVRRGTGFGATGGVGGRLAADGMVRAGWAGCGGELGRSDGESGRSARISAGSSMRAVMP